MFFSEARRVLREGGYLHISTPNPDSLGARLKGRDSTIYRDPTHVSVQSLEKWRKLTSDHGFTEIWAGTDTLWDPPYVGWIPRILQRLFFIGISQAFWMIAPGFRWSIGENILWLGRRD